MREILFRGKPIVAREGCIQGENFCYGYFTKSPTGKAYIELSEATIKSPVVIDEQTVGQYTGLTDKNGKKIFEDDILRNERGICYSACQSGVVKYNNGEFMAEGWVNFYAIDFCVLEVIGNIHDNPELMEG